MSLCHNHRNMYLIVDCCIPQSVCKARVWGDHECVVGVSVKQQDYFSQHSVYEA